MKFLVNAVPLPHPLTGFYSSDVKPFMLMAVLAITSKLDFETKPREGGPRLRPALTPEPISVVPPSKMVITICFFAPSISW